MTSSMALSIGEPCVAREMLLATEYRFRAAVEHNAHKFPRAEVIAAARWDTGECWFDPNATQFDWHQAYFELEQFNAKQNLPSGFSVKNMTVQSLHFSVEKI